MNIFPGVQDSMQIDGKIIYNLPSLITVACFLYDSTGAKVAGCKNLRTNATYVVPANKSFRIVGFEVEVYVALAANGFYLAYGDNDYSAGVTDLSGITNIVYMGGSLATNAPLLSTAVVGKFQRAGFAFDVPTGKYPVMVTGTGSAKTAHCKMYGFEI